MINTRLALDERFAECKAALDEAKPITLHYFRQNLVVQTKDDASPVTLADQETEAFLRKRLLERFPDDGFYGEETGSVEGSDWQWIIDPIDGTRAFIHGSPMFGTLIGLLYRGEPVISVCSMPAMNDVWLAKKGEQATLNGTIITTSSKHDLASASLATTSPDLLPDQVMKQFERLKSETLCTQYGGDCFNYMALATGWYDLAFDYGFQAYDILPLVTLIEAAGGVVTSLNGDPLTLSNANNALAAATPELHRAALSKLNI